MKIIDFPEYRQTFEYDCGAKALHSILSFYGTDTNEVDIIKIAGTNSKNGTPVHGMKKVAKHFGLNCQMQKMTIKELEKYIDKNIPVILFLQAWAERKIKNWKNHWDDGHYVVAIGYGNKKIYFEDPYSCFRVFLPYEELEDRWHDIDNSTGKKYNNLGIIITNKDKKSDYSSKKIIHMD